MTLVTTGHVRAVAICILAAEALDAEAVVTRTVE